MSVVVAWSGLLTIGLVINLLLTASVLRLLRNRESGGSSAARIARPAPGTELRVDPLWGWPDECQRLLEGTALVAFVVPGCVGCQILRSEFEKVPVPSVPLVVIADQEREGLSAAAYLADTWAIARLGVAAREPLPTVDQLGRPDELPVIALVRNGTVVASAHRLEHLLQTVRPSDWGPAHLVGEG